MSRLLATRSSLQRIFVRSFAKEPDVAPTTTVAAPPLYLKEMHEPKYLELLKPRIPYYDLVNVRVRAFDYPVLEEYMRFVQKVCKDLKLTTCKYWGVPATSLRLDSYQPASEMVISSEVVKLHERTVQVKYVTTCALTLLIDAIMCAKPPGVVIRVGPHRLEDDDLRYIPDLQLQALEKELETLINEPVSVLGQVKKKK